MLDKNLEKIKMWQTLNLYSPSRHAMWLVQNYDKGSLSTCHLLPLVCVCMLYKYRMSHQCLMLVWLSTVEWDSGTEKRGWGFERATAGSRGPKDWSRGCFGRRPYTGCNQKSWAGKVCHVCAAFSTCMTHFPQRKAARSCTYFEKQQLLPSECLINRSRTIQLSPHNQRHALQ